eukprot:TRINITY_DN27329_c0_g1_i1.p4 TRINITY_DN27329_c0_g1~~TRINITY_DN27329_c0_g1_i1.p4  ORF type:complete len:156 (+),score=56.69 TRINITY_DN27329_c0_g1_i1:205-672(+)
MASVGNMLVPGVTGAVPRPTEWGYSDPGCATISCNAAAAPVAWYNGFALPHGVATHPWSDVDTAMEWTWAPRATAVPVSVVATVVATMLDSGTNDVTLRHNGRAVGGPWRLSGRSAALVRVVPVVVAPGDRIAVTASIVGLCCNQMYWNLILSSP